MSASLVRPKKIQWLQMLIRRKTSSAVFRRAIWSPSAAAQLDKSTKRYASSNGRWTSSATGRCSISAGAPFRPLTWFHVTSYILAFICAYPSLVFHRRFARKPSGMWVFREGLGGGGIPRYRLRIISCFPVKKKQRNNFLNLPTVNIEHEDRLY